MASGKKKKSKKILILATLILLIAGAGAFVAFRKREPIITVQTERVVRRDITELVVANGKIQPVVQVVINPEVSGEIIALPVKDGQMVKKGDLLLKIKPDNYQASRNSAEANYKSALAGKNLAKANLDKAHLEHERLEQLYRGKLVSDSQYLEAKTTLEVMKASYETSGHQADQAKAALARAEDDLAKTTIYSPLDGTVTKLRSQLGERVVGTAMMAGTEVMTIANLNEMEARVDIGEIDVVLIALDQKARLEVEAFRDRKFTGYVTEIANASKGPPGQGQNMSSSNPQEATKFEVKIRITEKELFRPGMSVTAEIETRSRSNVISVPIQSVTTRLPKGPAKPAEQVESAGGAPASSSSAGKKKDEGPKPMEVVFLWDNDRAKMVPVKSGISDEAWMEITEGLKEGDEVISGGYKAISRELEDGKAIKKGPPASEKKEKKD